MQEKSKNQLKTARKPLKYVGLAITLFVLLASNCFGQSITWQRAYDGIDHLSDGGFGVCKADGDNIYVAGYTTFLPNRKWIYVLKLNSYGDTIWTRAISLGTNSGEIANAIVSNEDGSCVLTGDANFAFSLKLDQNGNIIWNKNYGGFLKQCYDIIKASDGGYIACGRDADCSVDCAYILKIDSFGNLQWQNTYSTTYVKRFYSIVSTHSGDGYIIAGLNINFPGDTTKGLVAKIDNGGNLIWEKFYRVDGAATMLSIKKIINGYLIGGNHLQISLPGSKNFIAKINEIGDTIFVKSIESNSFRKYFGSMEVINQNKYVISSSYDTANGGAINGNTVIIDSIGNILAEKFFLSLDALNMEALSPLPNGDIVFAGGVDFNPLFTREDIYVLRTDSMLNAPPPIAINNLSNKLPIFSKLYQNFPNPFNPSTIIKYEIFKPGRIALYLYDIRGKLISILENLYRTNGKYEYEISQKKHNLSSGVYFVKIETESGFFQSIKIILIK